MIGFSGMSNLEGGRRANPKGLADSKIRTTYKVHGLKDKSQDPTVLVNSSTQMRLICLVVKSITKCSIIL